jgi:hypothetical protein
LCNNEYYLLKIDIVRELHVLGVNPEDFESSDSVRNSDVDFSVETSEATEGRVDRVRSVCGGHHDHVRSLKMIFYFNYYEKQDLDLKRKFQGCSYQFFHSSSIMISWGIRKTIHHEKVY